MGLAESHTDGSENDDGKGMEYKSDAPPFEIKDGNSGSEKLDLAGVVEGKDAISKGVQKSLESLRSSSEVIECRICLENDLKKSLVRPCVCQGSVAYAHLACLKHWVRERGQVKCEICKTNYAEELMPELKPELEAGQAERQTEFSRRRSTVGPSFYGERSSRNNPSSRGDWMVDHVDTRPKKFWIKIVLFGGIFFSILLCLLFLGLYAGDALWAAILLRIIAFAIPLFIIVKALQVCWDIRRVSANENVDPQRGDIQV